MSTLRVVMGVAKEKIGLPALKYTVLHCVTLARTLSEVFSQHYSRTHSASYETTLDSISTFFLFAIS